MALPLVVIEFAHYRAEYTRAYKAGDMRIAGLYASLIHSTLIKIACGEVAL